MRNFTLVETNRIKLLTENSVEFTLIEPTSTGLRKSIMDATGPIRTFFKENLVHDYDQQNKGQAHKVIIESYFIDYFSVIPSKASLYRPTTKNGDPRLWFKNLTSYSKPNDILAIITYNKELFLLNISQINIGELINSTVNNPLNELVAQIRADSNIIADELLGLLTKIAKRGPVPAMLKADTAIGRTLEMLLGIDINSSKKPDYKGIEIKSFRDERSNRKNLFAQVPDWSISKIKSSAEILQNFGYYRGSELKLYCTVSTLTRNSQSLKLNLDTKSNMLFENSDKFGLGDFITWPINTLHRRLLEKHNETFWIAAESLHISGIEHFWFKKVEHTKKPILSQFDILLGQGKITLDHLIKKTDSGKVVEKGPIFKINPQSLGLLFPPSKTYDLMH